ncbi:SPOR domain-containing protein [Pseudotenacibaculum sp. MALMAid0570]|uniref:SPOR domain-containing protein n=1 Tax=Pseudotenacibaculum sp. MALMAid0570 TaxID=3143938 RepID=UPI0032E0105D
MRKSILIFSFLTVSFLSFQSVYSQDQKTDNELISDLISKKKDFNKKFGYGFRIQLYNGFEVEAKKMEAKFRIEFPEIKTYLSYRQPEWIIQIGLYKTQLEADRALNDLELKRKFGAGVIVVPLGK